MTRRVRRLTACFAWLFAIVAFASPALFAADDVAKSDSATTGATDQPAIKHADEKVDALLDSIEKRAGDTKSLSSKVSYTRVQGLVGDKQVRIGALDYAAGPPARFHLHLTDLIVDKRPVKKDQHFVFDGIWLVERDDDKKQFIKRQIVSPDAGDAQKDPLALGDGPFPIPVKFEKERVLRRFEVTLVAPEEGDPANSVHLRLVPKVKGQSDLVRIDLWYDTESLTPMKATTLDESENESIIALRDVKINEAQADDAFDTKPPKERGWLIEIKPWQGKETPAKAEK